jgi:hypothetical protein
VLVILSEPKKKAAGYLRTNWGSPFIIAFIVLLVASAAFLSAGQVDAANGIAVYAFYALVLGVVLQIASYVKYGEEKHGKPPEISPARPPITRPRIGWRSVAVVLIVIVVGAGHQATPFTSNSTTSQSTTEELTSQSTTGELTSQSTTEGLTTGRLVAVVNLFQTSPEANNSVQITFGINETGGVPPFNFTAHWSDGVNQSNGVGVFTRSFGSNQTIPIYVKVSVKSSDNQTATLTLYIPSITRTSTTTTTTTSIFHKTKNN